MVSVSAALAGRNNALGLVRLVLASAVIFHHSFIVGGFNIIDPVSQLTGDKVTLGSLAVSAFFSISGYLIAVSGTGLDVIQFCWRRFLRIFPAFWALLVVTAGIVGPAIWLISGKSLGTYFTTNLTGPIGYLIGNVTLHINNYGIYDIFQTTTPYGNLLGASVFNGSIWTLYFEWLCYGMVAVLVLTGLLMRARFLIPVGALVFGSVQGIALIQPDSAPVLGGLVDPLLVPLAFAFLSGATVAVYRKSIPSSAWIALVAAALIVLADLYGGLSLVLPPAATYLWLWIATVLPQPLKRIGQENDYSYGVYIYGFLVQQILAYAGLNSWGYLAYTLIALVISLGLAWLSWHVIEKRAMRLKDWGPGRGLRYWYDRVRSRSTSSLPA